MSQDDPSDIWKGASTLGETLYSMIAHKQTKTPEFQALVNFYGKEKCRKLFDEERLKRQTGVAV